MLFTATITKVDGPKDGMVKATAGTTYLLNGLGIQGLETRASTKSKFLYTFNPNDFREKATYMEAEESTSTITTDVDKSWQSSMMALSLHTGNVPTGATFTRSIRAESIILVEKDTTYPATKTWVEYWEGGKRMRVLCAYSIKQVKELGDTGDLTTS